MIGIAVGIFCLRLVDVPISTVRTIFTIRGYRLVSFCLGIVESGVWIFAISRVMQYTHSAYGMVGWSLGFSTGTVVGITIEKWIGSGTLLIRVISRMHGPQLKEHLHQAGFGVTSVQGRGREGEVLILFVVSPRRRENEVLAEIIKIDADAFITIEPVSRALGGFPIGPPLPGMTPTMKR